MARFSFFTRRDLEFRDIAITRNHSQDFDSLVRLSMKDHVPSNSTRTHAGAQLWLGFADLRRRCNAASGLSFAMYVRIPAKSVVAAIV